MRVLSWNGHKCSVSLTFDDADKSQAKIVLPLLNQYNIKGTFFIIANKDYYIDDWKNINNMGHEIGNHSANHKCAPAVEDFNTEEEIIEAQKTLEQRYKTEVISYAYPYTFVTEEMVKELKNTHVAARVGEDSELFLKQEVSLSL